MRGLQTYPRKRATKIKEQLLLLKERVYVLSKLFAREKLGHTTRKLFLFVVVSVINSSETVSLLVAKYGVVSCLEWLLEYK